MTSCKLNAMVAELYFAVTRQTGAGARGFYRRLGFFAKDGKACGSCGFFNRSFPRIVSAIPISFSVRQVFICGITKAGRKAGRHRRIVALLICATCIRGDCPQCI
mmetsp:Transcript_8747/g.14685  ORF Transcript_8747/g.14685 Transcript_8747/m.14685 type:complete len:105 (+) Transcript_8747:1-315(+)